MNSQQYARPEVLVDPEWVAEHLTDPQVRLVEANVDHCAYAFGHLPQAVGWNWKHDIQDPLHRNIPCRADFEALLRQSGITNETIVVLYGDKKNWFAAFAFWLLKYYDHPDVRLMNGGRTKWIIENRPLTTDIPRFEPTDYSIYSVNPRIRTLRDRVFAGFGNSEMTFVDVRSTPEFSGEQAPPTHQPQTMRGGHLPGAINVFWEETMEPDGTFKSASELQQLYYAHHISPSKEIIVYCGIGERSAHTWFVLSYLLGYPNVSNYDGSWAEWGNLIDAPIER